MCFEVGRSSKKLKEVRRSQIRSRRSRNFQVESLKIQKFIKNLPVPSYDQVLNRVFSSSRAHHESLNLRPQFRFSILDQDSQFSIQIRNPKISIKILNLSSPLTISTKFFAIPKHPFSSCHRRDPYQRLSKLATTIV